MLKPTCNTEFDEPSTTTIEVRVLPIPLWEGTFKAMKMPSIEHAIIILQDPLLTMPEPSVPPYLKKAL